MPNKKYAWDRMHKAVKVTKCNIFKETVMKYEERDGRDKRYWQTMEMRFDRKDIRQQRRE